MRQASKDAPSIKNLNRMRQASYDAPRIRCLQFSEKQLLLMRHASGDAPRIKGTFSTKLFREQLLLDAPRILWCATHQVKSMTGNALNDKPYSDAPRINRCAAHRNLALPEYKRDWGELFSLPPHSVISPLFLRSRSRDLKNTFSTSKRRIELFGVRFLRGIWRIWLLRLICEELTTRDCRIRRSSRKRIFYGFFIPFSLFFSWF